jgi:hypothetical protein
METFWSGKTFIVLGFLFLLVGLLFLGSHNLGWVPSLSLMAASFFFVVGWIVGTEQLVEVPFLRRIGVLLIFISVMSFTIVTVSLMYCEVGGVVRYMGVLGQESIEPVPTGTPQERAAHRLILMPRELYIHPYAWLSSPLVVFGLCFLILGLILKYYHNYFVQRKHQLAFRNISL